MQKTLRLAYIDTKPSVYQTNKSNRGVIMLINSLEKMERIVENNRALTWDGWTVVESNFKENGVVSKDGAYVNGRWIVQKRYDANANGWEIPDKFVR